MDDNFYPVPTFAAEAAIDFLESRSLEDLEEGVKRLGVVGDLMGLVQGIAITKIEREGLWKEAGYENLRSYRIDQSERLGMPRQTVSDRRRLAEGWLTFRKQLERFDLSGHVAKMAFLERALDLHNDKRAVVSAFKAMSYREFKEFALGPRAIAGDLPDVDMMIRDGEILIDGEPVLSMDEDLPDEERGFLQETLKAAYRARRGGCLAHVVAVYDQGEARAVDNFVKKRRSAR